MTYALTQFLDLVEDDLTGSPHAAFATSFISNFPEERWAEVLQVHLRHNPDHISPWWEWCQRQPEFAGLVASISARLSI